MKTKTLFATLLLSIIILFSSVFAQEVNLVLPVGHTARLQSTTFSPNGRTVVTAGDFTAKIWDVATSKLLYSLEGHTSYVYSALYSPDGKIIVTASGDGTAKIWDAKNGKLLHSLEEHTSMLFSAVFSPDGKAIVTSSSDRTAKTWDTKTGKLIHSLDGHTNGVTSATFSPDGKTIATASNDETAKLWDAQTGELLHSLEGHAHFVYSATYSQDGKTIATVSGDESAKIWDTETGELIHSLDGHSAQVKSAKYSPDGETIVTASWDNTAIIWDVETGNLLHSLEEHTHRLSFATYSPDGKTILTLSWDKTAKIWEAETGKLLFSLEGQINYFNFTTFSPDGKTIVTATMNNTVAIWDAETGKILQSLEGRTNYFTSATYSPDGKKIVTSSWNNTVKIWDAGTGKLLHSLEGRSNYVESATFSPDGKTIVTASSDNTAIIWDAETGKLIHVLEGHTGSVNSATFSPNGKTIVTASKDSTAKIWDSEAGNLILSLIGHTEEVYSAQYSPDGKTIVTASFDFTLKIWDAETGKLLNSSDWMSYIVRSATFSPDGKTIVTALWDTTAKIWDANNWKLLHSLKGHTNYVESATFSPDGNTIVTASFDGTAKIWDAITGRLLHSLEGHTGIIESAIYSPDGKRIITASWDGSFIIWDADTGKMLVQQFVLDGKEIVTLSENGLFDATPGAMEMMYYVQGLEIIEMGQLKDRYWEPDLWKKVMNGEELRNVTGFNESLPLFPKIDNLVIKEETIEFELNDQGGGIGKYFIYINGKEAFVGNDPKEGETYIKKSLKVNYNFKNHEYLFPGDNNIITVKAYNAENYIISRGANVLYSYTKEKKEIIEPNIFIISCGVSDYTGNQIDLRYAAKDAEDIGKSLELGAKQLFGIDKTFQYLLSTNGKKENWPTKANIQNVFEEIATEAKSTDIIVVYLSGHGINWGGQDGDFYYLTQDAYTASGEAYNDPAIRTATTLSSNELVDLFKKVPANKQVLIIDACASGQVVEDLLAQRDISSSTIRALDRMKDRTGMYIITGSAADAVSYEASKYGQGLLTYSLLEGIKGAALREDQFIDVDLLFQRAKDRVPQLAEGIGGIQEPQVFFPYGSASFDIGLLTDLEKELIPLAKEKPVFVMSTFMEVDSFDDILDMESLIDEELRSVSAKGTEASLIFYETKYFPDAYRLRGQYSLSGNEINLNLNIFYGKDKIQSVEIEGYKENIEGFVGNILKEISQIVIK